MKKLLFILLIIPPAILTNLWVSYDLKATCKGWDYRWSIMGGICEIPIPSVTCKTDLVLNKDYTIKSEKDTCTSSNGKPMTTISDKGKIEIINGKMFYMKEGTSSIEI